MTRSPEELLHAHFDGSIADAERDLLAHELAADRDLAERFAEFALLEASLTAYEREHAAQDVARGATLLAHTPPRHRRHRWARPLAALLALALLLVATSLFAPSQSASAALARIEERMLGSDRQYLVRVPVRPRDTSTQSGAIDGATLSVRGHDSYVLETRPDRGDGRIVGSDGQSAWTIPLNGPVRVSRDASRFRGWLPGSQHGVPFVADALDAESLRAAYTLRHGPSAGDRATIKAVRRPDARRGPREITIEYDPVSLDVLRMRLVGLPRARGGPEEVELTLVSRAPLPSDYFTHQRHHAADRRVVRDD